MILVTMNILTQMKMVMKMKVKRVLLPLTVMVLNRKRTNLVTVKKVILKVKLVLMARKKSVWVLVVKMMDFPALKRKRISMIQWAV